MAREAAAENFPVIGIGVVDPPKIPNVGDDIFIALMRAGPAFKELKVFALMSTSPISASICVNPDTALQTAEAPVAQNLAQALR